MSKNVEFMGEPFRIGDAILNERIKAGYRSAAAFSRAIENATGFHISEDALQRIEACRQEPKLSQYVAIEITLGLLRDPITCDALPPKLSKRRKEIELAKYGEVLNRYGHVLAEHGINPQELIASSDIKPFSF